MSADINFPTKEPGRLLLDFLDINDDSYNAWRVRQCPLGMTSESYDDFRQSLVIALTASGVTIAECDVRIQGTAATFYSVLKKVPYSIPEIFDLFVRLQDRLPKPFELERVCRDLARLWPVDSEREERRMFDLLYKLQIDLQQSDIDVQVSSDQLGSAAYKRVLNIVGASAARARTRADTYGFYPRHLISEVAPMLDFWASRQTLSLRRTVAVAVFDRCGPTSTISRHRETDWIVDLSLAAANG